MPQPTDPAPAADRPGFEVLFDGRPVPARPGESIGAALTNAGIRSWRATRRHGRPRGLFCGIGVCYDCLISVDGRPDQRACLTAAAPGMRLETGPGPDRTVAGASVAEGGARSEEGAADRAEVSRDGVLDVDVAVVGAGPAGLAAATTAAEAGLRVAVVDAGLQPGGQYWRHPDEDGAEDEPTPRHHDWHVYTGLRDRFDALLAGGRLHHLPGRQVWFVERPGSPPASFVLRLNLASGRCVPGPSQVRARSLVLCPGGYDRQLPVPGWDLPGVMAAGGVQALLKGHRTLAGRRVLVAGTGPFLLPVATGLAAAGAEVIGVCEASSPTRWLRHLGGALQVPTKGLEGVAYAREMVRHRIPYRVRTGVVAISGDTEVRSVTTAALDPDGRPRAGTERTTEVDLVALGWGFTPSLELVAAVGAQTRRDVDESLVACVDDDQRATVPGVYVAGEATGVGGAALAVLEGELAGRTVALDQGLPDTPRRRTGLRRAIRRARAFARAMHQAHPVPARWDAWLTPETVVCRCEEVTSSEVSTARDDLGAVDARTAKLMTRTGMGWCQGRVCGFATARLAAGERPLTAADLRPTARRPLCAPVSVGELADLHRELATGPGAGLDGSGPDRPRLLDQQPGPAAP